MTNELISFSEQLAEAVDAIAGSVVAVQAGGRFGASGVLWPGGAVVTADHLIQQEENIHVVLADGTRAEAELAGRDAGSDIAVLRLRGNLSEPSYSRADGLRPGHIALAVGRSAERGVTATMGVVSSTGGQWTTWQGGRLERFLRLDVAIYRGNSGAAVIDGSGRLIGMATTGLTRIAPVAVPYETIHRVSHDLLTKGRVSRGYLGVGLHPVRLPEHLIKKTRSGLLVVQVEPDSPASRAGVLLGDILVEIGGTAISDPADLQGALTSQSIGKELEAAIIRGGEPRNLRIVVGERPANS